MTKSGIFLILVLQLTQIMSSYCMEAPALKRQKVDNPAIALLFKKALETRSIDQLKGAILEADGDVNRLITIDTFGDTMIGNTMLGYAVKDHNLPFVDYLIQQGARVDKEGEHYKTPLLTLVATEWDAVSLSIMKSLLTAGASVTVSDVYGFFPLHYLASKRFSSVGIRLLVSQGSDVNKRNAFKGRTPLHLAVESDNQDAIHTLLGCGANPFIKDNDSESPIELAKRTNTNGIINDYVRVIEWIESGNE